MALTLVRHTTPQVAPGTCYGRLDLATAPSFPQESAAVLRALPPARPATLAASPLQRCRRLADVLGTHYGLAPVYLEGLLEMDFGIWEGVAWDLVPRDGLDAWAADFHHAAPHGGESVAAFTDRVAATLAQLLEAPAPVLVVTHAGVIRAALALQGYKDPWQYPLAFGEILTLTP
ncbi:MAG: alpha-ribazole phosphatase family protein [Pseudomonadota bacterium]